VGSSAFFNLIATRQVSFFADDYFIRDETLNFDRTDHRFRAGINFVHERGFLARIATSYVTQHFSNTPVKELPRSSFSLTDIDLQYEFAGKRGLASVTVRNAFDRAFQSVVEGVSVDPMLPERRILAKLRWRF
jgi:hypothetical protein